MKKVLVIFALLAFAISASAATITTINGIQINASYLNGASVTASQAAISTNASGQIIQTPSQTANTFLAAPNGSAGNPSYRAIVAADIPFGAPGAIGGTTAGSGAFTTLSASGVITSTVSTGTAPFTVASTTQVANLNAATAGSAGGLTGTPNISVGTIGASGVITSTVATGTAPFTVSSTTQVANLNAATAGSAATAASATNATNATYLTGTTSNSIPYQSSIGVTSYVTPVNNALLVTNSSGVPGEQTSIPGNVTGSTASAGDNSTKLATTAYVDGKTAYTNPVGAMSSIAASTGTGSALTGASLTAGNAYYFGSSGLAVAEANASTTLPAVCVAISTTQCVYSGVYRYSATQSWTVGGILYLSASSAGALTQTAPSTTGQFVQRVGVAIAADTVLIMPSLDVGGL